MFKKFSDSFHIRQIVCGFGYLLLLIFSQNLLAQTEVRETKAATGVKINRARGLEMLNNVKNAIKENYYDPKFRGINLDERFKAAEEKIKELETNGDIFTTIAELVLEFDDSHTKFYPPPRSNQVEYGFSMQIIGNKCFVTNIKKGSNAEAQGLKVGDVIAGVADYAPTRENLWKMRYVLYSLDPQENLKIAVLNADNTERELLIKSQFKTLEERRKEQQKQLFEEDEKPYKCTEISRETIACKLYSFIIEKGSIDKMMKQVNQYKRFILDLRGNRGGYVIAEAHLTGYFFDRDVKIGDLVTRKKTDTRIAKSQKEKIFTGDLMVLIDSDSASAAEVFARTIQIEKRGKIVGDISSGAVMTSIRFPMQLERGTLDFGTITPYSASITIGDLIMSDGSRLEKIGVIPDLPAKPTGKALFENSDPVLAYTAKLFGENLSAQDAGKFYFLTKKPELTDKDDKDKK